jgi:F1F0 ATPase subunit 2
MTSLALGSIAFLCGTLLGVLYFGGLWWTVQRLPTSHHFWRLYFGSVILRTLLVLSCLYLLLQSCGWQSLAVSMLGFVTARMVLLMYLSPPTLTVPYRSELE